MEKLHLALEKLDKEIEKEKEKNAVIQVIGNYVVQLISDCPEKAELVLNKEKTLKGAYEAMRKAAEKVKVGNCAVLSDDEGFRIVREYFGIGNEPVLSKEPVVRNNSDKKLSLNLDDLLR